MHEVTHETQHWHGYEFRWVVGPCGTPRLHTNAPDDVVMEFYLGCTG